MCGAVKDDTIYAAAVRDVCEEGGGEGEVAGCGCVRGREGGVEVVYGEG